MPKGRTDEATPANVLPLYIAAVAAAAGVAVALLPGGRGGVDFFALTLLTALALIAGARPVRFVGRGNEITATHAVVLCALAILGAVPALLTALAGLVATLLIRPRPAKPIRSVFNCACVVFSAAVASHLFFALGGVSGDLPTLLPWPLLAAAAGYFFVNTGLVSLAVALERGLSFHKVWDGLSWTASSHFTGVILALGMAAAYDHLGALSLVLGLPPVWVLLNFCAAYHGKWAEKEQRIREVEALNRQLRGKVDDLQRALDEVRELRGLLPICMHCKSIRDDDNIWHRIETYFAKHYDADFTFSLCERCRASHYDLPVGAAKDAK